MRYLWIVIGLLGSQSVLGQYFSTDVDADRILIGEPFTFKIAARVPAESAFAWPEFLEDTIEKFEILNRGALDTTRTPTGWEIGQELLVTSFDSGYFVLPPMQLIMGDDTLFSDPILIQVGMPEIDEEVPIYDIKDIKKAPFDWVRLIWWVLLSAIFLLAIYMVWRLIQIRGRKAPEPVIQTTLIPADEEALLALASLRKEALWEREAFKAHYDQLTWIFRKYVGRIYQISALEYTSDELIQLMRTRGLLAGLDNEIMALLQAADMAKFAKGRTDAFTAQHMLDLVENYIRKTAPKPQTTQKDV
jgi:hypothetical protein